MPAIQKGQSYPQFGFAVDNKGIARDLTTNESLSRADVDARLKGSGMDNLGKKRGGAAGFYDRNKKEIGTIAPIAAGLIPGVGPMMSAAIGASIKGGMAAGEKGANLGSVLRGAASGAAAGGTGAALKGTLSKGMQTAVNAYKTQGLMGAVKTGASALGNSVLDAGKKYVTGPDGKIDLLKTAGTVLGAVDAYGGYKQAKHGEKVASNALGAQESLANLRAQAARDEYQKTSALREAARARLSQLLASGGAQGPDLSYLKAYSQWRPAA